MASPVPAKSQPLHNFSLPHLKWKNHRTGRNRLAGEPSSSSSSPPPYVSRRQSPLQKRESESESESKPNSAVVQIQKPKTVTEKSTEMTPYRITTNRSNKICIRFGKNDAVPDHHESVTPEHEEDESSPKIWNLRPRRPPVNHKQFNGSLPKIGSSPLPENKNSNNREASELKINDRRNPMTLKKTKFSIALTRNEIEEDIVSMTGSKSSRRPKKRPKTVQRQLDTLFPGLWLGSITVDTYKVSEAPLKG